MDLNSIKLKKNTLFYSLRHDMSMCQLWLLNEMTNKAKERERERNKKEQNSKQIQLYLVGV